MKTPMTTMQAVEYSGYSKSYLYQLVRMGKIPCYKPADGAKQGKIIFCREELEAFLFGNRKATTTELQQKAESFLVGGAV